ncbi:MAG: ATP-dependent Clp protease ATP-binding subunit ClpC [Nitrospirae bacterium CG_4_10_14_3_um_filter_53_41]|nr:MAG: ATP-dependent Clp protease ATP-binding subunit ClpC [Nitrospirae bacterium CG_4_10_14_3_um_filter_53_41]
MFERFTDKARRTIILAREEAEKHQHEYLGTEHILLGILRDEEGLHSKVLKNLGINLDHLRIEVERNLPKGTDTLTFGEIPFTPKARKVLELAVEEARLLNHNYVGTEHILLGLVREEEGIAGNILRSMGASLLGARQQTINLLHQTSIRSKTPKPKSNTPALDEFGRDFTELARKGELDPVVGRNEEIERVLQILSRRTKNNPVLIGEPGVGKTAIVEGLAQRIVNGDVPLGLTNRKVIALDLGSLVAGTKYRGQFEERLKIVLKEIISSNNQIIIFIDELHTLVGAGAAEGSLDASNMLKPALARGEIQCIGATTYDEYRKYIEKDGALERRFQTINVQAPSVEETVRIIKGLRSRYEEHHNAVITDEAIGAAARLSDRYITNKFLPDKAIDVIDEAGSRSKLQKFTLPPEIKELKNKIKEITEQKNLHIHLQEFEKAARFRDQEDKMKEEFNKAQQTWREERETTKSQIDEEDIAYIVSKMTGVPLYKLEEKESEKLIRMEETLHLRVVGQDEAIAAVSRAIRRSRAGLKNRKKPIGSFIFLGPTGVGKTELARVLAEFLFDSEDALIRIDMSEYMERFSVSGLTGAPPGYVGYEEGGQLTEKVKRRPYSVILLDEIEKAHPDLFNILLQVLDDGRLTDNYGRTIDFNNTVLIMTSNLGTRQIDKGAPLGFQKEGDSTSAEKIREEVMSAVKKTFNPEFLNRVDDVIVFHTLTKDHISSIIDIMIRQMNEEIQDKGFKLVLSDETKEFLMEKGYQPTYGARPLRRAIQKYISDPLSDEILKGHFKGASIIRVHVQNQKITFEEVSEKELSEAKA